MKKLIMLAFLILSISNAFCADKVEEKAPEDPCIKDQASSECLKMISGMKALNPCMKEIENYCMDKEFKSEGIETRDLGKEINQCLDKNKASLSQTCKAYVEKKNAKPVDCRDKCMALKNDDQIQCLASCIINKDKKP